MKILLAVDGSSYTKKMLAYLTTHDEETYYREDAEKTITPVCKFLARHGIEAKSAWKVGLVGETIASFADAGKYDLIVMGSHGYGAIGSLVMGSVATQVLARGKVPVLLVR